MAKAAVSDRLPATDNCALRRGRSASATRCAIQAERASSKATVNRPDVAEASTSSGMLTTPAQAVSASAANSAQRRPSASSMAARLPWRSIRPPSHSEPTAPATTSATSNAAICAGVACNCKAARKGMARRLSMLPKLDTLSAASTRGKSSRCMAALWSGRTQAQNTTTAR